MKIFSDLATLATAHMPLQDCALCGTLRIHLPATTDERSTSTVSIFCEKDGASFSFKRRESPVGRSAELSLESMGSSGEVQAKSRKLGQPG